MVKFPGHYLAYIPFTIAVAIQAIVPWILVIAFEVQNDVRAALFIGRPEPNFPWGYLLSSITSALGLVFFVN